MPSYEYKCDYCFFIVEIEKSMDSPHPTECPNCGASDELRRVFSAPSFSVRGDHYVRDRTPPPPDPGVTIQPRSN